MNQVSAAAAKKSFYGFKGTNSIKNNALEKIDRFCTQKYNSGTKANASYNFWLT